MGKKIQGKKFEQPVPISMKEVIQEPQIVMETEVYPVGEKQFAILKQWSWADWLKLIAFASFGIFLTHLYNLIAFMLQMYKSNQEEVEQLKENQGNEIETIIIALGCSFSVFFVALLINKYIPTQRNKLLKDMRETLDRYSTVIARKQKGKNCE